MPDGDAGLTPTHTTPPRKGVPIAVSTPHTAVPHGRELLRDHRWNRGTAFITKERAGSYTTGSISVRGVVARAIKRYSHEFQRPDGVYLSIDDIGGVEAALRNYGLGTDAVRAPVTDAEDLLSIGDDQGAPTPARAGGRR